MNEPDITYSQNQVGATQPVLEIKEQFFKFPGQHLRITDASGHLLTKVYGRPFKLRETVELYSDDARKHLMLSATTKKIIDFNVTFILTKADGKEVGSVRRGGWSSEFVRDKWAIFNTSGVQIAELTEDSVRLGLIRRFVFNFLPQTYHLKTNSGCELKLKQRWNPFILHFKGYSTDYRAVVKELSEPLLLGALATIINIEGRQ